MQLALAAGFIGQSSPASQPDSTSAVRSAGGVLQRTLGDRASAFKLSAIDKAAGMDLFVVSAKEGVVSVAGSSGVAIARGAYHYLRHACNVCVTWEGHHLDLPARLPDFPQTRIVCPHQYRHYFNVCTFGYTMPFWNWERWEREIDWMALHGINMPLAMTGQEAVWQKLWREFGLSDSDIRSFFTGPAFLPWHWMGNIDSHCGPLPQGFIEFHAGLQRKILARERELGMTPVTPAFAGFVPEAFKDRHADVSVSQASPWCGFAPTFMLDPKHDMFGRIGRRFITLYREMYGSDHLYLADVFNEMTPRVEPATKHQRLREIGESIYKSIALADPQGIWVSQGWLFYNEAHFWQSPEVQAYLSGVPDDRMIILDLSCERMEVWRTHAAVRRKGWVWNLLHNFGGHTPLFGDGRELIAKWSAAMAAADKGNPLGMGLTMEAIEQNSWLYELATDLMWTAEPPAFDQWIEKWCAQRYGANPPTAAVNAWRMVPREPYPGHSSAGSYMYRPTLQAFGEPGVQIDEDRKRAELMMSCADKLSSSQLYQHDLVDVLKRYLARCAEVRMHEVMQAYDAGDADALDKTSSAYLDLLEDIDSLVGTRPQYRLSRWIGMARELGETVEEKNLMERNARTQITTWGGPVLHDYAAKEWSGLVRGMYAGRMRLFFRAMKDAIDVRANGRAAMSPAQVVAVEAEVSAIWAEFEHECAAWEERWAADVAGFAPPRGRNTTTVADVLWRRYRGVTAPAIDRGIAVGKPARDSGGTEGGHAPALAVDGGAGGAYWAAGPGPRWWEVDLQSPTSINRIDVFPYRDGVRSYQYTVEVSADAKKWTMAADMSSNTRPARAAGDKHLIAPITARYVRVNMLKNSANPSMHLHEVRVFAAGGAASAPKP